MMIDNILVFILAFAVIFGAVLAFVRSGKK